MMQMKVKGQISFCFVSQEPLVNWAQIFYAYGVWPDNHISKIFNMYQVMRPSWYANEGQELRTVQQYMTN